MADGITVSVDKAEMARIKALLGDLPTQVLLNGLRTGGRRIVRQVAEDAKQELNKAVYARPVLGDENKAERRNARKRTGTLMKAVSVKVKASRTKGKLYAGVGIDGKVSYTDEKGKKHRPINYGRLVEYGHAKTGGGVVAPRPFMRPAAAKLGPNAGMEVLVDSVQKSIQRAARKAARKAK